MQDESVLFPTQKVQGNPSPFVIIKMKRNETKEKTQSYAKKRNKTKKLKIHLQRIISPEN